MLTLAIKFRAEFCLCYIHLAGQWGYILQLRHFEYTLDSDDRIWRNRNRDPTPDHHCL